MPSIVPSKNHRAVLQNKDRTACLHMALEFLDDISLARATEYYNTAAPLDVGARYSVVVEYELAGHSRE